MLLPEQIKKIEEIDNPIIRQRYIKYYQLPEDLRQAILSEETANKIGVISQQNNLSETQLWRFSYLIGLVLLGEIPTSEFVKEIQKQCEINEVQANLLTQAVAKEIFYPVKESLRKIHGLAASVGAPTTTAEKSTPNIPTQPLIKEAAPKILKPIVSLPPTPLPPLSSAPQNQPSQSMRAIPVPQLDSNILDLKNFE